MLVSMGPDGKPGEEGVDDDGAGDVDEWQDQYDNQNRYPDPKELVLGKGDDIVVIVGRIGKEQ